MDSEVQRRDKEHLLRKRALLLEAQKYAAAIFMLTGEALNAIDVLPEIERALGKKKAPK